MNIKTKTLFTLIGLAILDMVIPIPFTTLFLIYVVLEKPPWFTELLQQIYNSN